MGGFSQTASLVVRFSSKCHLLDLLLLYASAALTFDRQTILGLTTNGGSTKDYGLPHKIGKVFSAHLFHNPRSIVLHGPRTQFQLESNFLICESMGDHVHHLTLARREFVEA
jgi:hypothetical protein